MNIIIADDEYYARKALCSIILQAFTNAGFSDTALFECEDAEDALKILEQHNIDLVFTDIKMHEISGITLCEKIHLIYPHTITIIISGYADFQYAQKAIENHVFRYLLKPIDEEDILSVIKEYFSIYIDDVSVINKNGNLTSCSTNLSYLCANSLDDLTKKLLNYYLTNKKIVLLDDLINQYIKKMIDTDAISDSNAYIYYNEIISVLKASLAEKESSSTFLGTCDLLNAENFKTLNQCNLFMKKIIDDLNLQMADIHTQEKTINSLIQYINEHYAENLSLYEIAENISFMHPNYLSKLLKSRTGLSFSRYIIKIRMEKAIDMLLNTNLSISVIGSLVGYNSSSYFVQTFRRFYGTTPNEFHKTHKEKEH